ncbi:TonB-dependent receptor domain-containing protein [Myroides guanonis]|uniref:Outer membrane receptor proteins, mostly Fe transport n=1 Tax=Myroides guanonis TaxID=1150112 RepID=A0A1I3SSD8_9FLAO|nr:TonB-dependent receptor [Myroides guanonis]SFJ60337.1 Outer membrane receptor proteins, mostly Fe transport [Myroides guanonis]
MKSKLLLFFALSCFSFSFAQSNGKVNGIVLDAQSNEPISYATITLKSGDTVITGALSDDSGKFSVDKLALQDYIVDVQFIGYTTKEFKITLNEEQSQLNLGTVTLTPASTQLDEVTVVAEYSTVEQKIDRRIINVGRDLTTAGATASEIMNNIPSVNVDQDGKISLRGNANVRVLIDGRPTNIEPSQLLKQIPSTSIKKIELITNPSAKYNPEGMSGIINIVLHKNTSDGFNGSISSGITLAEKIKNNNTLDMNYRKGKVNFFGNVGGNFGDYVNGGEVNRLDQNSKQRIDMLSGNDSYLYKIGMDYYINDKNTLSVYTNQNKSKGTMNADTDITYPIGSFDRIQQASVYDTDNLNSSYNLAFKHLFEKEGHTLDLEANYNTATNDQEVSYLNTIGNQAPFKYGDATDGKDDLVTINLDYVNPIVDNGKLELGMEARLSRNDNDYSTSNPAVADHSTSNYTYDTDIYSAYATFGQKFNKIGYQIGGRFESYKVNSTFDGEKGFKDDYITLYPSAYITYDLTAKDMFQLSYSRRVDRPGIWQTKPIRQYSTPTITNIGNPELEPQFTNSVELNYTRMLSKGSFTAGVFYRKINNEINHLIYDDLDTENPNDMIMTYGNFDTNESYGFELSANYKINSWWDIQPAIDFSSIKQKGILFIVNEQTQQLEPFQRNVDIQSFNARLNSNFKVTNQLRLNLFGFYKGSTDGLQFNSEEMYKIDAGARYTMLNNKLTFSLRVNDIFDTMKFAFKSDLPYPQTGEFTWESRSVYFGVNYMFGSGKNKSLQRKYRDSNTKQNSSSGGLF